LAPKRAHITNQISFTKFLVPLRFASKLFKAAHLWSSGKIFTSTLDIFFICIFEILDSSN